MHPLILVVHLIILKCYNIFCNLGWDAEAGRVQGHKYPCNLWTKSELARNPHVFLGIEETPTNKLGAGWGTRDTCKQYGKSKGI